MKTYSIYLLNIWKFFCRIVYISYLVLNFDGTPHFFYFQTKMNTILNVVVLNFINAQFILTILSGNLSEPHNSDSLFKYIMSTELY